VAQMKRLTAALRNQSGSATGDGRFISCGHAYWGAGPTLSWHRACADPSYLVGHASVESFAARWQALRKLRDIPLPRTCISLGPGTGEKDIAVVESLTKEDGAPLYLAVDMSAEMLQLHFQKHKAAHPSFRHMLPIRLDFSIPGNVRKLRTFLDTLVGPDEPIFVSFLGNTLANFTDDVQILTSLVKDLLRHKDDLLLLELATATKINLPAARQMEAEYQGSQPFLSWVTSALMAHTDLDIDSEAVQLLPSIERKRALVLKVVYVNSTKRQKKVALDDNLSFVFKAGETIRLELTRKYAPTAIVDLVEKAGLSVVARHTATMPAEPGGSEFGFSLVAAKLADDSPPGEEVHAGEALPVPVIFDAAPGDTQG
jgi:L-histidine Nalpha-methyltransferase